MNKTNSGDVNGLVMASSLISIGISIYLFARGNKETGIFVGLWAPTILGIGSLVNAGRAADAETP